MGVEPKVDVRVLVLVFVGVGVTGTPSIIFEDGRLLPGYLPAERLAQQLGIASGG